MIKLCVFDLDGTLLNTLPALNKIINLSLADLGLDAISEEDTKHFVGNGYKVFVDRALEHLGVSEKIDKQEAYKIYEENFAKNKLYKVEPYTGIIELISELKNRKIKTVVLSNKSQEGVEANIKKCFRDDFFDAVYGERQGIKIKPAPDALNLIIKDFGVEKSEVLYFGDSDVDMQTSINAGVVGVAVLWGFRDREELEKNGAKFIVEKAEDILKLI